MNSLVSEYEQQFAQLVGAPQARAFLLGRMGLYTVLKALAVGPGDRVGICGYTCLSVAEAVCRTGATCEFLDVDRWLNTDPRALDRLPAGAIKVLVTQYTFGVPSQLDEVLAWAASRGVAVVEDCCHALGSRWRGKHVGSFGAAAIYSSQWGKSYSTGQGGMLTINDPAVAARVDAVLGKECGPMSRRADLWLAAQRVAHRVLVRPGTRRLLRGAYHLAARLGVVTDSFSAKLDFTRNRDFLKRAGTLLARAGRKQLRLWPQHMAQRIENAKAIDSAFATEGIPPLDLPSQAECVLLRYPLRSRRKTELIRAAAKLNVDLAGWYDTPVHPLAGKQLEAVGYHAQCPRAEAANAAVLHLPTDVRIPQHKLAAIAHMVRESQ